MKFLICTVTVAVLAISSIEAGSKKPFRRPPQADFSQHEKIKLSGGDGETVVTISDHENSRMDLDRHWYYSSSCQQPTEESENQLQPGEIYDVTSPGYPEAYGSQDSDMVFDVGPNLQVQVECEEFDIKPPFYYYNTRECSDSVRTSRYRYWRYSFCGTMLAGRSLLFRSYSYPWKFHFGFISNSYRYSGRYKCYIQAIDPNAAEETTATPEVTTSVPEVTTPEIVEPTTPEVVEPTTPEVEPTTPEVVEPTTPEVAEPTTPEATTQPPVVTTVPPAQDEDCPCGHDPGALNRIVGGEEIDAHTNPWQVGLSTPKCPEGYICTGGGTSCGGTIIDKCYILTAAHCIDDNPDNTIRNFEIAIADHSTKDTEAEEIRIKIKSITVHEGYDKTTVNNDLAIIELETCLTDEQMATSHIEAACLPDVGAENDPKPTGDENVTGVISGWGKTSDGGSQSDVLKEENVTIYSDTYCQNAFRAFGSYNPQTMLCAGAVGDEGDSCQGDSGGPLVSTIDDKVTLLGVVSWGYGCDGSTPGVYADVHNARQWIADNTESKCLDI